MLPRIKADNVRRAAVLEGMCKSMCPEKERYERQLQARIAGYELEDEAKWLIDNKRIVKEYVRSSADQEEPLPHELRSKEALELTMNYLVRDVVAQCPLENSRLPSWYDFVWNRTRAIRKVSRVEQTLRNAELLYSLEMLDLGDHSADDYRRQNIAECMLSLKHAYEYLRKTGVDCKNEEEFRALDILLNLNVPIQVLSYPANLRNSPKVKLALKFYNAFRSNHYVSFFRLLDEQADFLQACVLHTHCRKVRSTALQIMSKAYGPSNGKVNIVPQVKTPLTLLKFDDRSDALNFLAHFGLSGCSSDGSHIILQRSTFQCPEEQPKLRHSLLIDQKCNKPIAQVRNSREKLSDRNIGILLFNDYYHYLFIA
ncbi:unnamed protein product [Soboliphyme baturini]|uniref:SAC3_GANP domain-containing protein n=1 Tax=Soboliphyme baturini TaxID=241478 RepID=A0A183ISP1_9BILA|nr:unnamed protein product [Soboliphyme baturini]